MINKSCTQIGIEILKNNKYSMTMILLHDTIPIVGMKLASLESDFCLTKNYFKYIKIVCMKLASLESAFQYESNDTNYI
jgi:hypothetical protein